MLSFIIPLRPKCTTDAWDRVCELLNNTLRSACNQTDPDFQIWIVHHEKPDIPKNIPNVTFLECPFEPPAANVLSLEKKERIWHMHSDKGRKLLLGLESVRKLQPHHMICLDADDFVSNQLSALCNASPSAAGWYFDRGYLMFEDQPNWLYTRSQFYKECGSSHILRTDFCPFPDELNLSLDFSNYYIRRYVTHAYLTECMQKQGTPIAPLPFAGAVYQCHSENIYAETSQRKMWIRNTLRWILRGKRIKQEHIDEFSLPIKMN